ncbi:uncharacterized protein G2W53_035207 [Senna tora]|uniref:Uncharacterized protein n=1 Tax=Senna tora TaxID=362788 RepID=A0A834SR27_9FABA|nr:uncharacterized protein G2W53_035207 [Senna tora]
MRKWWLLVADTNKHQPFLAKLEQEPAQKDTDEEETLHHHVPKNNTLVRKKETMVMRLTREMDARLPPSMTGAGARPARAAKRREKAGLLEKHSSTCERRSHQTHGVCLTMTRNSKNSSRRTKKLVLGQATAYLGESSVESPIPTPN